MSIKRIVLTMTIALCNIGLYAQVGIGTEDPKASLDIKGQPTQTHTYDGVIFPEITGQQLRAKTYGKDQNGAMIYVTTADPSPQGQTRYVTQDGYYRFDYSKNNGTSTPGAWVNSFLPKRQVYLPYEVKYTTASRTNVVPKQVKDAHGDYSTYAVGSSTSFICRKDIGYSLTLKVPAHSELNVLVTYSLPVGYGIFNTTKDMNRIVNFSVQSKTTTETVTAYLDGLLQLIRRSSTYCGVTFYKSVDGAPAQEEPMGSRKSTLSILTSIYAMTTISGNYVETLKNTTNTEQTYTYTLKGYIEGQENGFTDNISFIFNEFDATGQNYNWGKGSMVMTVFKLTQL